VVHFIDFGVNVCAIIVVALMLALKIHSPEIIWQDDPTVAVSLELIKSLLRAVHQARFQTETRSRDCNGSFEMF